MMKVTSSLATMFYIALFAISIIIEILWIGAITPIRKLLFGPILSKSLVTHFEKQWMDKHPGWPKKFNRTILFCDGEEWEYRDDQWRTRPKNDSFETFCRTTFLNDGTILHYEEWKSNGVTQVREWRTLNDALNTPIELVS